MSRIIIADDNLPFLELLAAVCASAGWEVDACNGGRELIDAVASGDCPVLLLIDIYMPEIDGVELIEHLRKFDRPLRVRFMTGGDSAPLMAAQLIAGIYGLSVGPNVFKPLKQADLLKILVEEDEILSDLSKRH